MKRSVITAAALAAILTLSGCKDRTAAESAVPAETAAASVTTQVTVSFAEGSESAVGAAEAAEGTAQGGGDPVDAPAETVPVIIPGTAVPDITAHVGEITQIHLPAQTVETTASAGNKVFLISVDPETTDEMMREVTDKYDLEVVYDYENFNMYALAVPEPLDSDATAEFIKELQDSYDFILTVEPDSVMYLDDGSAQ